MSKPKNDLATLLANAHADLAGAAEEREALIAQLADGADVGDELTAVENEIARHKLTIARLQDAQALAGRKVDEQTRVKQHKVTLENLSAAEGEARELAALSLDALAKIDELGAVLTSVEDARRKLFTSVNVAINNSTKGERAGAAAHNRLNRVIEQLTQSSAFTQRLYTNGVGSRGVLANRDYFVCMPLRGHFEPEREADEVLARMQNLLADIAGWSASTNGVTENAA